MEFDYSRFDEYDLRKEMENLKNGMATFSEESKKVYSEAWNHRKRKFKALSLEFNKRELTIN